MKIFKAKHKSTGLYLRVNKDGEYTLSKYGSVLSEIKCTQQIYDKKVALYCSKYTKLYESTYKILSWNETWKSTRMFVWAYLGDFEIEDL